VVTLRITGYEVGLARLDLAFVHELQAGERRLFLLVTKASLKDSVDSVLGVPCWKLNETWRVIGLPAVKADQIWVVKKGGKERKV
jgi:hypothetical protein